MLDTGQQSKVLQGQESQGQEGVEQPTPPNPHQQCQPTLQQKFEFAATLLSAKERAGESPLAQNILARLQIQVSKPSEATLNELVSLINSVLHN